MLRKNTPEENSLVSNKSIIDNQRRKNKTEGCQRIIFCRGKVIVKGERNHNALVEYLD